MRALILASSALVALALPPPAQAQLEIGPLAPVGAAPKDAARVGDRVVFSTTEDGALWTTDGATAGTAKLRAQLEPHELASDGETAYFTDRDDVLHRTDGTPEGTRAIATGIEHTSFAGVGRAGPAYVFRARPADNTDQDTLWRTDGTAAGTRSFGLYTWAWLPEAAAANEQTLLVKTRYYLVRTDGETATEEGAARDAAAIPGGFLTSGLTDGGHSELFRLDAAGTNPRPVADVDAPRWFARLAQRVLFQGDTSSSTPRWYSSDLAGGDVQALSALDGSVHEPAAVAGGAAHVLRVEGDETLLYRTDGTDAGTVLLGRFDVPPSGFTAFAGRVWFAAGELWSTDGSAAGTRQEADIVPGPEGSDPRELVATDDFLFFAAGGAPWRVRHAEGPTPGDGEDEPPPAIVPTVERPVVPAPGPVPVTVTARRASVTVQVKRLRSLKGVKRWRVSGQLRDTGCSGRVRVDLARVKAVTARVQRCRFNAIVSSRRGVRWIAVRTVPTKTVGPARSRVVAVH